MTITARYPGTCPQCGQPIQVGQSIEWDRGARARHTKCPAIPAISGYEATRAFVNASPEAQERYIHTDRDGYDTRRTTYRTCSECGQGGYDGSYPFSTGYGGNVCDDCGA